MVPSMSRATWRMRRSCSGARFMAVARPAECAGGKTGSMMGSGELAVAVGFGPPGEEEEARADDGGHDEHPEGKIPAVVLGEIAETPAREDGAQVAEQTGEADGGAGRVFGREVGGGD